ncbi:hypothetical protein P43SY_002155 [Pythium insidiosum]|uniref:AIG1-type G domain-containing protein n=1 Tax=Pythium insidiosum TaxID=114742 RepID=A0AAD5LCB6_PYTIN|nr:hypothetical protein P43SY_002155 [Pythium insidiosum]
MPPQVRENRLFMGNPGTGKSTLINCLVGESVFQSGLSWGGGLTKEYQKYVVGDIAYMDTPGLADRTIVQQAAKAITKALSEPGNYKLFFMVRLQNGRVQSEDLTTVERVLDSIDVPDIKFSILINNLGKRQFDTMMNFGAEFKQVAALINHGKYSTPYIFFIPTFKALEERDNQVIELPAEVVEFMESRAPIMHIPRGAASSINTDSFEAQARQLRDMLETLRSDNARMMDLLVRMQQRHGDAIEREREYYRRMAERQQREAAATRSFYMSQQQRMLEYMSQQQRSDDCVLM